MSTIGEVVKLNREVCKGVNWITKERWEVSGDNYGLPDFCFEKINEPLTDAVSYSDVLVFLIRQYNIKEYLEIGISVLKNLFQIAHNTETNIFGYDINEVNEDVCIPRPWGFLKGNVLNKDDWEPLRKLNKKHDLIFSDALHDNTGLQAEWDFYLKDHLADNFIIVWDDAWENPPPAPFGPVNYIKKHFIPELEKKYGKIYTKLVTVQEWVRGVTHPIFIVSNYELKSLNFL